MVRKEKKTRESDFFKFGCLTKYGENSKKIFPSYFPWGLCENGREKKEKKKMKERKIIRSWGKIKEIFLMLVKYIKVLNFIKWILYTL